MAKEEGNLTFDQLLGRKIRIARKQSLESQREVEEVASLPLHHAGRIERGEHCPTAYTLYKIAIVLDLDLNKAFQEIEEMKIIGDNLY